MFETPAAPPEAQHLLIPFAGADTPDCRAVLSGLQLPVLEALLARLTLAEDDADDAHALSPPHERALAAALGLTAPDGCIPWAAHEAAAAGLPGATGTGWAWITLCHWQVSMDNVMLGDPQEIGIDLGESRALLSAAQPFFADDGIALYASAQPGRWLASGEVFRQLPTASLDRVVGRGIAGWLPMSEAARPLRRLQNEMQMLLYTQRVNDERTARGAQAINSFWLSGTGALPPVAALAAPVAPTVDNSLRDSALTDDGLAWAAAWRALDAGPLNALLRASQRGADVTLTLCGDRSARRYTTRQRGFGRWVKSLFGRQRPSDLFSSL